MCFFGSSKKQGSVKIPDPAPAPSPAPVPVQSDPNPVETADQRRKRVGNLRQGVLSTIKAGGGTTGGGSDFTPASASGKMKIGL